MLASRLLARAAPRLPRFGVARAAAAAAAEPSSSSVRVQIELDDMTELPPVLGAPGETLMAVLARTDVGDMWSDAGACGGACSCSTCRVVLVPAAGATAAAASAPPPPDEEELDMLDTAARTFAAQQLAEGGGGTRDTLEAEFLDGARLSCQIALGPALDGLRVRLVGVGPNMLEVPLWLRNR